MPADLSGQSLFCDLVGACFEKRFPSPLCHEIQKPFAVFGRGVVQPRQAIAIRIKPVRVEGRDDHRWVLMDFGGFVVHVLDEEFRAFYDLERLWSDCPRVDWQAG